MPWPTDLVKFVRIGRVEGNDIVLDDLRVSSRHARLMIVAGSEALIEDLGSSNGTFLNSVDLRVTRLTRLSISDTVYFGSLAVPASQLLAGLLAHPPPPSSPRPAGGCRLPPPERRGSTLHRAKKVRPASQRPGRQLHRRKSLGAGCAGPGTPAGVPDRLDLRPPGRSRPHRSKRHRSRRQSPRRPSRWPSRRRGSVAPLPSRSSRGAPGQTVAQTDLESLLISLGHVSPFWSRPVRLAVLCFWPLFTGEPGSKDRGSHVGPDGDRFRRLPCCWDSCFQRRSGAGRRSPAGRSAALC